MGVKIPDTYYCGRKDEGLAFITPDGTDTAAQKRKSTVQSWTRGYSGKSTISLDDKKYFFSFPNRPMQGFKLKHAVARYRTQNKMFRVEDPRGFEIEISAWNLADICQEGGIQHGNFMGTYVYGRDGRDNVLLATGSPRFKEAFEFTKAVNRKVNKVSLRDLKIGQKVELLAQGSRHEVIYIGRRWQLETNYCRQVGCDASHPAAIRAGGSRHFYSSRGYYRDIHTDRLHKPRHMFLEPDVDPLNQPRLGYYYRSFFNPSSPVVTKILQQDAMTPDEVEAMVKTWAGGPYFPYKPSQWERRDGYNTRPDSVLLFTLDKAEAEKIYNERKEILENWVPTQIPPEGP